MENNTNPDWEDADDASQREYEAQLAYEEQQYQCYEDAEHLSD